MKRKTTITKRSYNANVRKFAKRASANFAKLEALIKKHCRYKSEKHLDKCSMEFCEVIDAYIGLNLDIYKWCDRNGVDKSCFICDTMNKEGMED